MSYISSYIIYSHEYNAQPLFYSRCKSNYDDDERVPVFKMPHNPDQLRRVWIRALHREHIHELKAVYVCSKHFREDEVEITYKVPNGDGTYREMPQST